MENEELAVNPATEQAATAAPESIAENSAETNTPDSERVFSQEELNTEISKRLARQQRKFDRQLATVATPAPVSAPPQQGQFDSVEAYADALAHKKAEELIEKREYKKQHDEQLSAYQDMEEEARTKYSDFEQVVYNPNLQISDVMAQSIQSSENGPEIAYFLGANPKEADRISRLQPIAQAKEIGRIEAKLALDPPTKRTSNAPPPIDYGTARGGTSSKGFDTTDPRSIKTMNTSQWIEAERMRQIKKWEANSKYR